tara:strand:+ start:1568 stop:2113 length:546 start_codon:yes stop_codon:yes gene_type:complete
MSYKTLPYTYGAKSLSDINALTGMTEGDTVYNLDWNLIEVYNGDIWVNDQAVSRTIKDTELASLELGMAVKVDTSGEVLKLTQDNSVNIQDYVGVVARITGDKALVAHFGRYQALFNYEDESTIQNGTAVRPSDTPGLLRIEDNPKDSPSVGVLGYTVQAITTTQTSNYLCWVSLQTIEMQ